MNKQNSRASHIDNSINQHIKKGYFGKYANYGDYVQHGLPAVFIEQWSEWCQRCLVGMQKAFKQSWTHYYVQSPVWTFVLYDPTIYSTPLTGLITPNQDNKGRYFPLTFIQAMTPGTRLLKALLDNQEAWDQLESFALNTRGKMIYDPQILAAEYNRLAPLQFKEQTEEAAQLEQYGPYGVSGLLSSTAYQAAATYQDAELIHILDRFLSSGTQAVSYWFARVDDVEPCLAAFNGLPEPEEFAWLLGRYEPEDQQAQRQGTQQQEPQNEKTEQPKIAREKPEREKPEWEKPTREKSEWEKPEEQH